MVLRIFRLSFSLLWCFAMGFAVAQDLDEEDTVEVAVRVRKPDSLREKIYFRSVRFGTDVLALARSGPKFKGWEANVDFDLGKFYLAGDYGASRREESLATGGTYRNDGTYWRVGLDVNLLKKDPDKNMFFLGLRYARSAYTERVMMTVSYPGFGDIPYDVTNPSASAAWMELLTGLRVKIWKEFWMGYTARLKFSATIRGNEALGTYEIPGYGVVGKGSTWGFNYQIFWRIPLSKKKGQAKPALPPGGVKKN